jgi:protein subunit release factor A
MKPFLRSQLERYAQRLGELDFLLSREDIMSDMAQYRRISVEHAEVTQIAGRYARYQQREADLAGAREMLADPDMAEMAQEEIDKQPKPNCCNWKTNCSACCCPRTPTTRATRSWKSARARAVTNPPCSQAI